MIRLLVDYIKAAGAQMLDKRITILFPSFAYLFKEEPCSTTRSDASKTSSKNEKPSTESSQTSSEEESHTSARSDARYAARHPTRRGTATRNPQTRRPRTKT